MKIALIAQSVERWSYEPEVEGSIPSKSNGEMIIMFEVGGSNHSITII